MKKKRSIFDIQGYDCVTKSNSEINRQENAYAGNVTQKIHPPLKQSTLIHTQTHTYRQSYINSLKIHLRHTLNKGED